MNLTESRVPVLGGGDQGRVVGGLEPAHERGIGSRA